MPTWTEQLLWVGTASAGGLLIGIERGWRLRLEPEGARVAGVRTFFLLGLLAGLAGLLARLGYGFAAGGLVVAPAVILVLGYGLRPRATTGPDATTAIAALVTLALGFVAGVGIPGLAIAGAALATLALALRSEAHCLIARLEAADVKALARYAVIAGAVLPFLPSGSYGPYGAWNPQELWWVVVLVTGLSFAGYVANRVFGARRGTIATALIGGAYSSTAVTYAFAQRLGAGEGGEAENAGIAIASAVMYLRVAVLVGLLAPGILAPFAVLVAPPFVVAAAAAAWLCLRAPAGAGAVPSRNPIALLPALSFVVFVAAAAVAARWAAGRFGEEGIAALVFILGTFDVDAAIVTVGGLDPAAMSAKLTALALAGTILANMGVKLGVTLAYARARGRAGASALAASTLAVVASLLGGFAWL